MDIFPIITAILSFAAFCDGRDSTCNKYESVKGFGKLIWNIRLRSTYLQFHPTTLKQCAIECLVRRGRCKSINFSRQMSFCELNYRNLSDGQAAEKCTSFDYSDINTWSTDLIGKCKHKVCSKRKRCLIETGKCSMSDCGPVEFDIPKNSVLQNHGHHETGTAIDFLCKKGYRMYHKDTLESMYVAIIMCKASGDWDKVKFVCLACDRKTLHVQNLQELVANNSSLVNEEYALKCKSGYMPYINGTTKVESVTVTCNVQTHKWEKPDFECKKCEPISFEIPKNSILQNYSEHEVGNSINFTCKPGYLMYNKTTDERMYDGTMKCNASGQWGDVEFVCLACDKNKLASLIDDFAEVLYHHWSLVDEKYAVQCISGYTAYVKGEPNLDDIIVTCDKETNTWEVTDFVCKGCDRNKLKVDTFAKLVNYYTLNPIDNYLFQCESGYIAYVNGTPVSDVVNVTCNKETQEWNGQEFFCKNPKTMSEDFCQNGYNYDKSLDICWKFYYEKRTHQQAQKVCMDENAHLVVATEETLRTILGNFSGTIFIDGKTKNGQFQGWAKQSLNYSINPIEDDLCAVFNRHGIGLQNCSFDNFFLCQFELCPKTAGYTYDVTKDICYNYNDPSPYSQNTCNRSTIPYNQKVLQNNTGYQKSIYRNLQISQNMSTMQSPPYFLSSSKLSRQKAESECQNKGMSLAVLDTNEQKKTASNIMDTRVQTVLIGLVLDIKITYVYSFTDGTISPYFVDSVKSNTDKNHCIVINKDGNYHTVDCTRPYRFLCTGSYNNNKTRLVEGPVRRSFYLAVRICKNYYFLRLAKIHSYHTLKLVTDLISTSKEYFYIDLKLHHKNYTYVWTAGGYESKYIYSTSEDFEQGYTNDTRDDYTYVVYNATSMKFELTEINIPSFYLCGTTSPFAWYDGEDLEGNPYAINLDTLKIAAVDKKNVLPYVCEIDTNSRIIEWSLNEKKRAFP